MALFRAQFENHHLFGQKNYSESALILRVQNSPLLFPIDIQNFFIVALVPLCYQEKKDIGSNLITLISSGS